MRLYHDNTHCISGYTCRPLAHACIPTHAVFNPEYREWVRENIKPLKYEEEAAAWQHRWQSDDGSGGAQDADGQSSEVVLVTQASVSR